MKSIVRKSPGFTIVEMMVAIAIIAVLLTLVFTAVRGAMAEARERHAEALCRTVEAGLAAYHAQYDEWPGSFGGYVKSDNIPNRGNREGFDGVHDANKVVLEANEVREMVRALVDEAKKGNPLMDISGLYVSRDSGENGKSYGMDFLSAVRGTKQSQRKMNTAEMYFGYPDKATGRFRRFKMVYSVPSDSLSVTVQ